MGNFPRFDAVFLYNPTNRPKNPARKRAEQGKLYDSKPFSSGQRHDGGIGDYRCFCRAFTQQIGISPGTFRKKQREANTNPEE